MTHDKPIAVIGAGITGAFTAYRLAEAGYPVVILDSRSRMAHATPHNPGGVNPLHGPGISGEMAPIYWHAYQLHQQWQPAIQQRSAIEYNLRVIRRVFLAFNDQDRHDLAVMQQRYQAATGFTCFWLEPQELLDLDDRLSPQAIGGMITEGNMTVDSSCYRDALLEAAQSLGARLERNDVSQILHANGAVNAIETPTRRFEVAAAVIAAGAWTQPLLHGLGLSTPIVQPITGDMVLIDVGQPLVPFDVTYGLHGFYHHAGSHYWLGGTESVGDLSVEELPSSQGLQSVLDSLRLILPGLRDYKILNHCIGYRPRCPDSRPLVGLLPGYTNLYASSGGGSKGILLSSWLAHTMTELVSHPGSPSNPVASPLRFS